MFSTAILTSKSRAASVPHRLGSLRSRRSRAIDLTSILEINKDSFVYCVHERLSYEFPILLELANRDTPR
jgi:hypothetical protein